MPLTTRVRPRIGDIVEIPTPDGLAYVQYTHQDSVFGAIIRVLPGMFAERPTDFSGLVGEQARFTTLFAIGAVCFHKLATVVAAEPIPEHARRFPTFRYTRRDAPSDAPYRLCNDSEEWRVDSLTPEQLRSIPVLSAPSFDILVEHIVTGWTNDKSL